MLATRDTFGLQLVNSSKVNKNVVALSADLGKATKLSYFQESFPDRFFEVGIAECNMIGIASGLADFGFRPFIASFASFLTGKYDVIRVSIGYSNSPVVLVGTHAGLAIGRDGVTQMGLEDISLMRSIPNMQVIQPATPFESKLVTKYLAESENIEFPAYLRLGRQPVEEVLPEDYKFEVGKAQILQDGSDIALFSTGCILPEVLKAAKILASEKISAAVINVSTIKPLDIEMVIKYATKTGKIVTIEDHSIIGGLGSAVAEIIAEEAPANLTRIGIKDTFPESGKPLDLWDKYGLSCAQIVNKILESN